MKISAIVTKNFYDNPDEVREYALNSKWYYPYHDEQSVKSRENLKNSWNSNPEDKNLYTRTMDEYTINQGGNLDWESTNAADTMPGNVKDYHRYITEENVSKLENIIGKKIDMNHFYNGTKWNGVFHSKKGGSLNGGKGIHCHIEDGSNDCTQNWREFAPEYIDKGWAGVVFLTPDDISYENNGLDLWENRTGLIQKNVFERTGKKWIYYKDRSSDMKLNEPYPVEDGYWDMTVRVQFKYNTLVLHRADEYHAGSNGWGDSIKNSRMIQTFFFREKV